MVVYSCLYMKRIPVKPKKFEKCHFDFDGFRDFFDTYTQILLNSYVSYIFTAYK